MTKSICKQRVVSIPRQQAWALWSTQSGLESFFAPKAEIELWPGKRFEVHFFPNRPKGERGAEDLIVLSLVPERMLSFQWDAPPHIPEVREHKNWVVLEFDEVDGGSTKVTLMHLGWKEGEAWDEAFRYFSRAWDVILDRFVQRVHNGPIDWADRF